LDGWGEGRMGRGEDGERGGRGGRAGHSLVVDVVVEFCWLLIEGCVGEMVRILIELSHV
jgi:hypothetical protein